MSLYSLRIQGVVRSTDQDRSGTEIPTHRQPLIRRSGYTLYTPYGEIKSPDTKLLITNLNLLGLI